MVDLANVYKTSLRLPSEGGAVRRARIETGRGDTREEVH